MPSPTLATLACALLAAALLPAAGGQPPLNARSPIGTNLAAVVDWSTSYPFVDHWKSHARPWFAAGPGVWEDPSRPLALDGLGNPLRLLEGQYARTVLFSGRPADPGLARKRFLLLYTGDGDLQLGNVDVLESRRGRVLLQVKAVTGPPAEAELIVILTITRTSAANRLRAFRLVPAAGGVCAGAPFAEAASAAACVAPSAYRPYSTHHASILFNPQFLSDLRIYRLIRFMDWQRTNDAPALAWSQRALTTHQFWSTDRGVPLEVMVRLANILSAHPWFCIPHRASRSYITAFARVVRQQLSPRLQAHLEWSNEVWNDQFEQARWALEQAGRLGLAADRYEARARFYSERAQEVFAIAAAEFGGTQRIRRVMAYQAVVPWYTGVILGHKSARQLTDLYAVAPYFGASLASAAAAAEAKRLGLDGLFAWLLGGRSGAAGPLDYGSLADVEAALDAQLEVLRPLGIPLASYEGGQHFVGVGGLAWDEPLNQLLDAANRDARMRTVYLKYLAAWRARTPALFVHFVHCDRWSPYGRWGAKEYPGQPRSQAPKWDALLTHARSSPTAGG